MAATTAASTWPGSAFLRGERVAAAGFWGGIDRGGPIAAQRPRQEAHQVPSPTRGMRCPVCSVAYSMPSTALQSPSTALHSAPNCRCASRCRASSSRRSACSEARSCSSVSWRRPRKSKVSIPAGSRSAAAAGSSRDAICGCAVGRWGDRRDRKRTAAALFARLVGWFFSPSPRRRAGGARPGPAPARRGEMAARKISLLAAPRGASCGAAATLTQPCEH
jgi:hypothetical protein